MRPDELADAVAVVARAMSTSPMSRAVFGSDPERCRHHLTRLFTRLYDVAAHQRPLVARSTAACRLDQRPGRRRLPAGRGRQAAACAGAARLRPAIAWRAARWLADWERRDPDRPHAHYGPFGVEPELQGRGIGSLVIERVHPPPRRRRRGRLPGDRQARERGALRALRLRGHRRGDGARGRELVHVARRRRRRPGDRPARARLTRRRVGLSRRRASRRPGGRSPDRRR